MSDKYLWDKEDLKNFKEYYKDNYEDHVNAYYDLSKKHSIRNIARTCSRWVAQKKDDYYSQNIDQLKEENMKLKRVIFETMYDLFFSEQNKGLVIDTLWSRASICCTVFDNLSSVVEFKDLDSGDMDKIEESLSNHLGFNNTHSTEGNNNE